MNTGLVLLLRLGIVTFAAVMGLAPQQVARGDSAPIQFVAASSGVESHAKMEQDKVFLNRLLTVLRHSARSFIYLRSKGFNLSDREFEQLIASNDEVFRRTRIVRRDEHGVRQIPGWPGVALTTEYKPHRIEESK